MAAQAALLTAPVPINKPWAIHVFLVGIVMPVLATFAVVLRVIARRMRAAPLETDDWLIFTALIVYYFHSVVTVLTAVLGGSGHNIDTLAPSVLSTHLKLLMGVQIAYALTLGLVKSSVCILYKRIFIVDKNLVKTVRVMLVVIVCWTVMTTLIALASCTPFSYNWDKNQRGHCGSLEAAFAAVAALDITVDLAILLLPIPRVWNLYLPFFTKVALTSVFALGFFDLTMGVLRIVFDLRVNFEADWTYTIANLYFWSTMEPGLAIIVACAPVIRPIFEKLIPKDYAPWTRSMFSRPAHQQIKCRPNHANENAVLHFDSHGYTQSTATSGMDTSLKDKSAITMLNSVRSEGDTSPTATTIPDGGRGNDQSTSVINVRHDITVEEERRCFSEKPN